MAYNAEREDTKSNLDYQRNVALLGIKGANSLAAATAKIKDSTYTDERLRQQILSGLTPEALQNLGMIKEDGGLDAEKLNGYLTTLMSTGGSGNPPPLTQQETEAAAKAAGKKEFVYQGERFEVR